MQGDEHAGDGARIAFVHRETLVCVVERAAEPAELLEDRSTRLCAPFPDAADERLTAEVEARQALVAQLLLDDVLGRDPRMIGAADPERLTTAHALVADQRVLDREVERVAHVQRPGDVRWRHGDHVGLARVVGRDRERAGLVPASRDRGLDGGRVVAGLHGHHRKPQASGGRPGGARSGQTRTGAHPPLKGTT